MSLQYAVLGLLAQQPGSGYDLLRRFESTMGHVWPATQSQLYTELGKMAQNGLIEVTGTGARNRKDYAITTTGREQLTRWLEHPAREAIRSATLLQVFLLSEGTPAHARRYLDELAEQGQAKKDQLEQMEHSIPWDESSRDVFARRVLDYGIRQARTELDWITDMRASMDS